MFIKNRKITPVDFFDYADEKATYLSDPSGGIKQALISKNRQTRGKTHPPPKLPAFGVDLDLKIKTDFGVLFQELPEAYKAGFGERLTEAVDTAR
jgi:hypothetical protein